MSTRIASIFAATAFVAFAAPCAAQVEERGKAFYIAPLVNAVRADDDRDVDDDSGFSLATGFEPNWKWNLELNLFRSRLGGAGNDDLTTNGLGIDALRVFRREARVTPYALVGLGAQSKERTLGGSSTDGYAEVGGGFLTTLRRSEASGRALFLRFDMRARYDDADGGGRLDHLLGVGLQYAFGAAAPRPAAAEAIEPAPLSGDEDMDGVPDNRDRCPETATGALVGTDGCEIDSDDDRLVDSDPGEAEIRLPLVTFEFNSDRLQPAELAALEQAIVTLRVSPELPIEVAGYTDSVGSEAYNLSLSQRRAEAVRRFLVAGGVENALTVRGYGESLPAAPNGSEAGRAQNRRVVLRILSP